MLTVRPKVAELVFQVYGRPLHPELFEVCSSRIVQRGGYEAKIDITGTGHVVTWRHEGLTLTEVVTSAHHPLPEKRRLISYRLKGQRSDHVDCRGGVRYEMSFQLESLDPDRFWAIQEELTRGQWPGGEPSLCRGMLQRFDSNGRMALGAISYLNVETRNRTLLFQAFHTFPDDYAIVMAQSQFQIPKPV